MPTLYPPQTFTYTTLSAFETLTLTEGLADSITAVGNGPAGYSFRERGKRGQTMTWGPFPMGTTIVVAATQGTPSYQFGGGMVVVSSAAPVNADGLPNGTVWIQTA